MKIKIMLSGPLPPPLGGMETYCQDYLRTDIPEKFEVTFCRCILIKQVPTARGLWGCFLRFVNRLLTLSVWLIMLIVKRPDIVHVHTNSGTGFFARGLMIFLGRQLGSKTVLHMHGGGFKNFYNAISDSKKKLIRYFLELNSFLIVLSEEWRMFFISIGINPAKISVKTNSVFLPQIEQKNKKSEMLNVLFLSRISKEKGIFNLIEAIKIHSELTEKFRFIIAGPKNESFYQLKAEIEALGFSEIITMPGPLIGKDKDIAYRNADIYLLPSFIEASPIGLLEAMSYGLACITTPVGGIPDVIQDRSNGLLIEPGDPNELANALKVLANDLDLISRLGTQARRTIEQKYNWHVNANELSDLYIKLLA